MATNSKAIGLLFGVKGGADLNGHSGVLIKKSIQGIVDGLKGSKYTQIELNVSQASLDQIKKSVEGVVQNVEATLTISSDSLGHLRDQIRDITNNIDITGNGNTQPNGNSNGGQDRTRGGGQGRPRRRQNNDQNRDAARQRGLAIQDMTRKYREYYQIQKDIAKLPDNDVRHNTLEQYADGILQSAETARASLQLTAVETTKLEQQIQTAERALDKSLIMGSEDETKRAAASRQQTLDGLIAQYKEYVRYQQQVLKSGADTEVADVYSSFATEELKKYNAAVQAANLTVQEQDEVTRRTAEALQPYNRALELASAKARDLAAKQGGDSTSETTDAKLRTEQINGLIKRYKEFYQLQATIAKESAGSFALPGLNDLATNLWDDIQRDQASYNLTAAETVKVTQAMAQAERNLTKALEQQKNANASASQSQNTSRRELLDRLEKQYKNSVLKAEYTRNAVGKGDTSTAVGKDNLKALVRANREYYAAIKASGLTEAELVELRRREATANAELARSLESLEAKRKDADVVVDPDGLYKMESLLLQYQKLSHEMSVSGIIGPDQMAVFNAQFDTIEKKFHGMVGSVNQFGTSYRDISRTDLNQLLSQMHSLLNTVNETKTSAYQLQQAAIKNRNSYEKLANKAQDYYSKIQSTLGRDPAMKSELENLIQRLHSMDFTSVTEGSMELQRLQFRIKQAGLETETLGETISRVFKTKFGYGIIGSAALFAQKQLKQMYQEVVKIDTKMTDLQIVSGATGSEMKRMLDSATASAKKLAASITDVVDATTVYNRLGFDTKTSLEFAELTTMYSKVGDVEISEAENNLTAIIKAFDISTADQLSLAMDQMVETANKYSSDAAGLGEGLQDAASALVAAGNSYEDSLAMLTAANSITQNAGKSSTALRTIAARLRQSTTELEELGEDSLDSEYDTASKYRDKLLALSGVDILEKDQKTYRSTVQILRELAAAWDDIADVDKASIVTMVAGVRQSNVFNSLMTQWGEAESVLDTTKNAQGAMASAYETYTNSIEGSLNTLTAAYQEFSAAVLDSDTIANFIQGLTGLLEILTDLVNVANDYSMTIPVLVGAGSSIFAFAKSVKGTMADVKNALDLIPDLDGIRKKSTGTSIDTESSNTLVQSLWMLDDVIAKLTLSETGLSETIQDGILSKIAYVKQNNIILESCKKQIVEEALLKGVKKETIDAIWEELYANAAEVGGIKLVTEAMLKELLVEKGLKDAEAAAIARSYARGAAYRKEAGAIDVLKAAGAKLKAVFTALGAAGTAVTVVSAALVAGIAAWAIWEDHQDKLLQEAITKSQEYASEVSDMESELEDVRSKMAEIQALDAPTLTDAQELENLKEQNDELERELRLLKVRKEEQDKQTEEKALSWLRRNNRYSFLDVDYSSYGRYKANTYSSQEVSGDWETYANHQIQQYEELQKLIRETEDELINLDVKSDPDGERKKALENELKRLEYHKDLTYSQLDEFYQNFQDNVVAGVGDVAETEEGQAFLDAWEAFLDRFDAMLEKTDSAAGDVETLVDKFERAFSVSDQYYLNSSNFGGNVDLTTRRQVPSEIMNRAGWNDVGRGDYATVYSSTYTNDDGTHAIVVTPILPNGEVLSPQELDDYVDGLLDGATDTKGITLGVFDGEDAQKQADIYAERVHEAQAKYDEFIDSMVQSGTITKAEARNLEALSNSLFSVGDAASDTAADLTSLTDTLSGIVDQYDLMMDVQAEYSESNMLSLKTLESVAEKFPEMEESIALYITGLKTSEELLADLSDAYKVDEENYYKNLQSKLDCSTDFYNNLSSNQKKCLDELYKAYGVDGTNFKTVEDAKLAYNSKILQKLTENWKKYAGMSLEQLKVQYQSLADDLWSYQGDGKYEESAAYAKLHQESTVLYETIQDWEKWLTSIDEIAYDDATKLSWNPAKYSQTALEAAKDAAKDAADEAEDAFEKLKEQLEDWFSDMEFQVELKVNAGDIAGATEMYQRMVEKARDALDDAFDMGLTIEDDWVQTLIDKINDYNLSLADLRLDELDKFIELNDAFDGWNDLDLTKLDKLVEKLEEINKLYEEGLLTYKDYYDLYMETAGDIYDIQREALDDLLETTMDALEEQNDAQIELIEEQRDAQVDVLEEQISLFGKLIDKKKKLLEDTKDESDYEEEVAEKVREIAKLQERISQLALDDSRSAAAERAELEEELYEKQKELADYQNDYALDKTLEALDEQGEAFEESKNKEIDAAEDAADEEIKVLKAQLDNEYKLRKKAIELINSDYQNMMVDVRGYFEQLGITIDDELLGRLQDGLDLISQYGDYDSASSGITGSASSGLLPTKSVSNIVSQMKSNSASWHDADAAERKRLEQVNENLAQQLRDMGLNVWKDAAKGIWYIKVDGKTKELFKTYHQGGVVSGAYNTTNREVMALLEKGEVVLDDAKQKDFIALVRNSGQLIQERMATAMLSAMDNIKALSFPAVRSAGLQSYAPSFVVNISHNGAMDDADAKHYGESIADTALDKLWSTLQKRGIT